MQSHYVHQNCSRREERAKKNVSSVNLQNNLPTQSVQVEALGSACSFGLCAFVWRTEKSPVGSATALSSLRRVVLRPMDAGQTLSSLRGFCPGPLPSGGAISSSRRLGVRPLDSGQAFSSFRGLGKRPPTVKKHYQAERAC